MNLLFHFLLGINIFLDGFVPTENLRFREAGLVFKVSDSATEDEIQRLAHYNYPTMVKELGEFRHWLHGHGPGAILHLFVFFFIHFEVPLIA